MIKALILRGAPVRRTRTDEIVGGLNPALERNLGDDLPPLIGGV